MLSRLLDAHPLLQLMLDQLPLPLLFLALGALWPPALLAARGWVWVGAAFYGGLAGAVAINEAWRWGKARLA